MSPLYNLIANIPTPLVKNYKTLEEKNAYLNGHMDAKSCALEIAIDHYSEHKFFLLAIKEVIGEDIALMNKIKERANMLKVANDTIGELTEYSQKLGLYD